jgi:hypothetical protein
VTGDQKTARERLKVIVQEVRTDYGYRKGDALDEIARRFETSPDRHEALRIAADRLYGEKERDRKDGLREGYSVQRNGQLVNLTLLGMRFGEARLAMRREMNHAEGARLTAAWDRYLLEVCEGRARERGLDPDETVLVLGEFVADQEARELYREWRAA